MIFPGRPLYVRLIRSLTPEKPAAATNTKQNKVGPNETTPRKSIATGASASVDQVAKYKHTVLKPKS